MEKLSHNYISLLERLRGRNTLSRKNIFMSLQGTFPVLFVLTKHKWNSKELTTFSWFIYLRCFPGTSPQVWFCLLFPKAKVRGQSKQPSSKRWSEPSRSSDWGVIELTNCKQIRHLTVRNETVGNDLENNWKVVWEVVMDHFQVSFWGRRNYEQADTLVVGL